MFEKCPCGSEKLYLNCCKPYIKGVKSAPTPEALMRSRYTAYELHKIEYIMDTCTEGVKNKIIRGEIEDWSNNSLWLGLEIISTDMGESLGTVEFKAVYEQKKLKECHHEIASFKKEGGRWLYASGRRFNVPVKRSDTKQGRNEYCICGSGKKYKNCCGR